VNAQLTAIHGPGTTESQSDWSIWSVAEDVAIDGTCSKRKRAFLKNELPRYLEILEKSARDAHPMPAPWHITTGLVDPDEVADYVFDMNWSGWWFRHICRAADILKIPCPDERFADEAQPWNRWGFEIDIKLEHRMGVLNENGEQQVFPDWTLPPVYRGNRYPGKEENAFECSVPIPDESVALAQLAEQASKCDEPEDLEVPSILRKYF
jgi:hypothetical protein